MGRLAKIQSCNNNTWKCNISHLLTKLECLFTKFHAGLIPLFTKKKNRSKLTYLTFSVSRQNPFIKTQSTVKRARMHCFLFSVGTLPLLSTSSPYEKEEVVQTIIIKMCLYDLHICQCSTEYSHVQPQKKKKKKKKNDRELLVENGFIIHNKCRNVKHTTQLKQLTL